jgi:hypothetical protein
MTSLATSAMLALPLLTAPALAEVYKWVDEAGKVNYGDKPPPGRARALDRDSGRVSVVQGMPKGELDRLRLRNEQERAQELERELDALRAREQALASAVPRTEIVEVAVPVVAQPWPWRRFPAFTHPPVRRPGHPAHRDRAAERTQPPMGR